MANLVNLGTLADSRVEHCANGHKGIVRAAYLEESSEGHIRPRLVLVVEATTGSHGLLIKWYLEDVRIIR